MKNVLRAAALLAAASSSAVQAQVIVGMQGRAAGAPVAPSFTQPAAGGFLQMGKALPGSQAPAMSLKAVLPGATPAPKVAVAAMALPVSAIPMLPVEKQAGAEAPKPMSAKEALISGAAGIEAAAKQNDSAQMSRVSARMFHGAAMAGALPGSPESAFRSPDSNEDQRINKAFGLLQNTVIGGAIYADVQKNYGSTLRIFIDDNPQAQYDARISWNGKAPMLVLTRSLVNDQSPYVLAAYAARELSELYYDYFPRSAERSYMAYGSMVRTYAELTNSDLRSNGYAWDTRDDQRSGNSYAMYSYYSEWKKAVRSGDARASEFFRFLKTTDDSHAEPEAKLTLREQYNRGLITYTQYRERDEEFRKSVDAESQWLEDTNRL